MSNTVQPLGVVEEGRCERCGTIPASVLRGVDHQPETLVGRGIEFAGTIKPGRDAGFGIWSRPTGGRLVN